MVRDEDKARFLRVELHFVKSIGYANFYSARMTQWCAFTARLATCSKRTSRRRPVAEIFGSIADLMRTGLQNGW